MKKRESTEDRRYNRITRGKSYDGDIHFLFLKFIHLVSHLNSKYFLFFWKLEGSGLSPLF